MKAEHRDTCESKKLRFDYGLVKLINYLQAMLLVYSGVFFSLL